MTQAAAVGSVTAVPGHAQGAEDIVEKLGMVLLFADDLSGDLGDHLERLCEFLFPSLGTGFEPTPLFGDLLSVLGGLLPILRGLAHEGTEVCGKTAGPPGSIVIVVVRHVFSLSVRPLKVKAA